MNKFLRKMTVFILAIATMFGVVSGVGCSAKKKEVSNDSNTLEVYLWNAGFGNGWLTELLKDFGTLDWVKDKYPNYQYATTINDQNTFGESRIAQGSNNTIDLFFTTDVQSYYATNTLVDLSDCLYNSEVPGENILFKDKINADAMDGASYSTLGSPEKKYYTVPWCYSMTGIVYNASLFERLSLSVPRTTDELIELAAKVKSWEGKNPDYPYTFSLIASQIPYTRYVEPIWTAQYDGIDNYDKMYQGIYVDDQGQEIRNSTQILYERGRYYSYDVLYKLLNPSYGYYDRSSSNNSFIVGQTNLLLGKGLFMFDGDWFSNEMKDLAAGYRTRGYDDVIRMMKTPVVSALTDKLNTIKTDEVLRQVIDEIDSGATSSSISGVSKEDFDRVCEARGVIYTNCQEHLTVIPAVASAKELAIDFLRYMATNRANAIYAKYTSGGRLPFNYNLETDSPEVYSELLREMSSTLQLQTDCSSIFSLPYARLIPNTNKYDFVAYGGFSLAAGLSKETHSSFVSTSETPEQRWQKTIDFYTANSNKKWNAALTNAGLQ